jgi:hypothetical protein
MKSQFSQNYDIDNRRDETEVNMSGAGAVRARFNNVGLRDPNEGFDNTPGAYHLKKYIERKRDSTSFTSAADRATEGRFIVSGPGSEVYGFRNAFRPSK